MADDLTRAPAAGLRFTVLGFPVVVHAGFFVMGALLGMTGGGGWRTLVSWLVITFFAVLGHELGHALVARAFGLSARIELYTMGGLTYHDAPPLGRWQVDFLIAIAGPSVGLALGGAVWIGALILPPHDAFIADTVRRVLWVNVGWSLINLLPILPYDGGLALRALLAAVTPRAGVIAEVTSVLTGAAATGVALRHRWYWAAYLAIAACVRSASALMARRREQRLQRAWEHLYAGRYADALAKVQPLLAPGDRDEERAFALELAAWVALHGGAASAARERLAQMPGSLQGSSLLRATLDLVDEVPASVAGIDPVQLGAVWPSLAKAWVTGGQGVLLDRLLGARTRGELPPAVLQAIDASLFYAGDFQRAADLALATFAAHHLPIDAYNAACSYARLGDVERALTSLEAAIDAGFTDATQLHADDDLALVMSDPRFARLSARIPR